MNITENKLTVESLLKLKMQMTARVNSLTIDKIRVDRQFPVNLEDQVVSSENDEVAEMLDRQDRIELKSINDALTRITEGEFGICFSCGEEISKKRLKAVPYTTHCLQCANSLS
jgi:RNA polymerase-binding transcription factor DksA